MLRRLIYPVPAWDPEGGLPVETTAAGTHLVHAPAPEGGRTIVYFHGNGSDPVSYTHLTLPTMSLVCRSRWSPYH